MRSRPTRTGATVALITTFIAVGCGAPTSVTTAPGEPVEVDPSEVRVLGTSISLAEVRDLTLGAGGNVWVLNSVEPFFLGFDEDGAVVDSWGARGDGPEEFRTPVALVEGGIGTGAWAYDQARHSLIRISHRAEGWAEVRLSRDSLSPGRIISSSVMPGDMRPRISSFGTEVLFDRAMTAGGGPVALYRSELVAVDPTSGALRVVASLADLLGDPGEVAGPGAQFAPFPVRARCSADRFAVYDPLLNQVREFGRDGAQTEARELPPPRRIEITVDALVSIVMGMAFDQMAGMGSRSTASRCVPRSSVHSERMRN